MRLFRREYLQDIFRPDGHLDFGVNKGCEAGKVWDQRQDESRDGTHINAMRVPTVRKLLDRKGKIIQYQYMEPSLA